MPTWVYHLLHLLGILMVFTSYGALIARSWTGSTDVRLRKLGGITSGIGLVLILISAFGLQAKLGIPMATGWFWVKFGVWVFLGVLLVGINRKPALAPQFFWLTILLGFIAVLMVYLRPF